ncbi:MAG: hypothetical protein ACREB9_07495, partial [Thermoplasmata archaeon]
GPWAVDDGNNNGQAVHFKGPSANGGSGHIFFENFQYVGNQNAGASTCIARDAGATYSRVKFGIMDLENGIGNPSSSWAVFADAGSATVSSDYTGWSVDEAWVESHLTGTPSGLTFWTMAAFTASAFFYGQIAVGNFWWTIPDPNTFTLVGNANTNFSTNAPSLFSVGSWEPHLSTPYPSVVLGTWLEKANGSWQVQLPGNPNTSGYGFGSMSFAQSSAFLGTGTNNTARVISPNGDVDNFTHYSSPLTLTMGGNEGQLLALSGGTMSAISVEDYNGNVTASGTSSLTGPVALKRGYKVVITYTVAPTVMQIDFD